MDRLPCRNASMTRRSPRRRFFGWTWAAVGWVSWRGGQAFRRRSTGEDLDLPVGLAAETDESAGQMAVAVFHYRRDRVAPEPEWPPSATQTRSATPTGITSRAKQCRAAWGGRSALAKASFTTTDRLAVCLWHNLSHLSFCGEVVRVDPHCEPLPEFVCRRQGSRVTVACSSSHSGRTR